MKNNSSLADSIFKLQKVNNYNRWIYDNIKPYVGRNVLEIGCGIGNITDYFISPDRKITGIDIDEDFVDVAKEKYKNTPGVTIAMGDALNPGCTLPGKSYDTVMLLNVLEHIQDDLKAVKCIFDLLEPKGRAIILVPAMKFAYGELDRQLGHHKRYEKPDMIKLYAYNGFEIEKLFYMNWIGAFGWAFNSRILRKKLIPEDQSNIMDKLIVPIIKPLEDIVKPFFGQSLIAVGKRIA
jgi:SAM-dependent methyltransferase